MSFNIPTYIKDVIDDHRVALATAVDRAVQASFVQSRLECRRRPGEVDKVLQFFIDGVEEIETRFNAILQPDGVTVSVASIFTHQTPYVNFRTKAAGDSCCEMADLCMLATYGVTLDDPASGLGNALFLQAKENFDAPLVDRQRQLYEKASRFQYARPIQLKTISPDRRQLPSKRKSALSYWEFSRPRTSLRWSHDPLVRVNFSDALVDFIAGESGYGFRLPRAGEESWSRIIFDLLTVTANACANRHNLKVRNQKRGAGTIYRRLFHAMGGDAGIPFVVRNSLGKILKLYGPELEKLGREIEATPDYREKEAFGTRDKTPEDFHNEPPILGNNFGFDGDGNGGAGNFILIQFTPRD